MCVCLRYADLLQDDEVVLQIVSLVNLVLVSVTETGHILLHYRAHSSIIYHHGEIVYLCL